MFSVQKNMLNTFMPAMVRSISTANMSAFGEKLFKGKVAEKYLEEQGLAGNALEDYTWTTKHADEVASAVLSWAKDNDVTDFCHWFQPLGSGGYRHGLSGQVYNTMIEFRNNNTPMWKFKGKDLLQGETDGSSYNNGGLRGTHQAGGYAVMDPSSSIFMRDQTLFIPSCLVSYYGKALDEKTPLLRAMDALSREGSRLLGLMGYDVDGVDACVGLEQEIFLIPREAYLKRPDLQMAGRTVIGKDAPRGQELCDHYMGSLSSVTPALKCLEEIQSQAYELGIPLRTKHREVAPNQYEMCPLFGVVNTQVDQNLIVMQIIEETAAKYGLVALLQEKPFNGINGSGKHNNWSLIARDGTNLLNPGQLSKNSGSTEAFPVIMSAIVKAVDTYGDLMRAAVATPGNDFRLGAMEAPPAIISTYLGDDMTTFLEGFKAGNSDEYIPNNKDLDIGVSVIDSIKIPAEDRNRTSPFPYGGHRFEFRAVGSSQNVSLVNTILCSIAAKSFKTFADAIEAGSSPSEVARGALEEHWKVIFNGDNYDLDNQAMLTDRGVWRIDSGVDAIARLDAPENVELFDSLGVMSEDEVGARKTVLLDHYVGTVEIEVLSMLDMINQHVLPSAHRSSIDTESLERAVSSLRAELANIHSQTDEVKKADLARTLRLETMIEVRTMCDSIEAVVPAHEWSLATYTDLLFLDQTTKESAVALPQSRQEAPVLERVGETIQQVIAQKQRSF